MAVWMYTDSISEKYEVILYIVFGVVMLVLNTAIQYKNEKPYRFVTGVTFASLCFVVWRLVEYLQHNDMQWVITLVSVLIVGSMALWLLIKDRPRRSA